MIEEISQEGNCLYIFTNKESFCFNQNLHQRWYFNGDLLNRRACKLLNKISNHVLKHGEIVNKKKSHLEQKIDRLYLENRDLQIDLYTLVKGDDLIKKAETRAKWDLRFSLEDIMWGSVK